MVSMLEIDRRGQPGFTRVFRQPLSERADVFTAQIMARSHNLAGTGTTSALTEFSPEENKVDILTEDQIDLLRMLGRGLTNEQIAKTLHFSLITIKVRCSKLYLGLGGVRNRTQAVVVGIALGLISTEELLPEGFDPKKIMMPPKKIEPPEETEPSKQGEPTFTDEQLTILKLTGRGLAAKAIGADLGYFDYDIKNRLKAIYRKFRRRGYPVYTRLGAVLTAINLGEITPEEMVEEDFDFTCFESLTETERTVLKKIAGDEITYLARLPYNILMKNFNIADSTVNYHLRNIFDKLGTRNIVHVAVLFLAYKRHTETV